MRHIHPSRNHSHILRRTTPRTALRRPRQSGRTPHLAQRPQSTAARASPLPSCHPSTHLDAPRNQIQQYLQLDPPAAAGRQKPVPPTGSCHTARGRPTRRTHRRTHTSTLRYAATRASGLRRTVPRRPTSSSSHTNTRKRRPRCRIRRTHSRPRRGRPSLCSLRRRGPRFRSRGIPTRVRSSGLYPRTRAAYWTSTASRGYSSCFRTCRCARKARSACACGS